VPPRRLQFVPVVAGLDARGSVHAYYGRHYVGCINPAGEAWQAWLHGVGLGRFERVDCARRAIVAWYYGPDASDDDGSEAAVAPGHE
jgi:hypothetical protein